MYRRSYLYYAVFVLYGSILPFDFAYEGIEAAVTEFRAHSQLRLDAASFSEIAANYLIYMPLGFLLSAGIGLRGTSSRVYLFAASVGLLTSLTAEGCQAFIPGRYASLLDVLINTFGAVAGAGIGELWLQSLHSTQRAVVRYLPSAVLAPPALMHSRRLALPAAAATVLYALLLVLTFAPVPESFTGIEREVSRLWRVPFTDFQSISYLRVVSNAAVKLLLFFPLGVLLTVGIKGASASPRMRRTLWQLTLPLLLALVLGIEIVQLALPDKTASLSDTCIYLIGVFVGVLSVPALGGQLVRLRTLGYQPMATPRPAA